MIRNLSFPIIKETRKTCLIRGGWLLFISMLIFQIDYLLFVKMILFAFLVYRNKRKTILLLFEACVAMMLTFLILVFLVSL